LEEIQRPRRKKIMYYDYKCDACGHIEEIEQRITDDPYVNGECPMCGTMAFNRTIGLSNFILKGGGWYKDGYSSKPSADK
jgi:putative FmdB family regulatory protein